MLLTTLTLAAGLLLTPMPQAESQKGWVVEMRGYTYHKQAKRESWVIELRGYTYRVQAKPKAEWIIEFQWREPESAPRIEPVDVQYHDDLRPVFDRLKGDAIEAQYHDDLRALFRKLRGVVPRQ
jgi:hypothetical protein